MDMIPCINCEADLALGWISDQRSMFADIPRLLSYPRDRFTGDFVSSSHAIHYSRRPNAIIYYSISATLKLSSTSWAEG